MAVEVQVITNTIEVVANSSTPNVEVAQYTVDVILQPTVVEIAQSGAPGPKGDKGDKGDPGDVSTAQLNAALSLKLDITKNHYIHTQTTLNNTWTINHGLGRKPQVEIRDLAGQPLGLADIVHNSDDVCVAVFSVQIAGTAYCS